MIKGLGQLQSSLQEDNELLKQLEFVHKIEREMINKKKS